MQTKILKIGIIGIIIVAITMIFIAQKEEPSLSGEINSATFKKIEDEQNIYFKEKNRYLQVMKDNIKPPQEIDIMAITIPDNMEINIYESPKGWGYEMVFEDADNIYSRGYGPEAEERTWTQPKPDYSNIASTTP